MSATAQQRAQLRLVRRRCRRVDELTDATVGGKSTDQLVLEDKIAKLIDRVPPGLLFQMVDHMDDDELLVLELLAQGISSHHDFLPVLSPADETPSPLRVIGAARRFAAKRTKARKGGA